ncbi:potassium channel family protein [sulfur-oxidizing endosymbiont of Gigantopelta aegis]|uniref:potassium channel family protein n=1 Tax=sulfur-oxidizing endosymbiont of Gigantopelta aegis TaxID=2794934 RepID=UPI0018DDF116|nr:NAD-binding protein [sulfur-oxidizing endosymbiont of Gigantopelta aegis]
MNSLLFLLLKRIRLPIMLLIISYAIVILGFVLIPGQDDQGNVWHMSFFHAFYFVSFMGSTIGFGEIPYEFTNAQRMWTVLGIYITVTIWLYSIGALISTLQNPAFKKVLKENEFRRKIKKIKEPFYLICGYGDTGKLLAHELSANHFLSVVIDLDPERIESLEIDEPNIDIPALAANASFPQVLETAGLTHECCQGVIALTNKDEVNLKIAITARLLNKERMLDDHLMVVCRAETAEAESNMASFGTSHIINPFDIYARRLALSVRSPSAYLVYEWLTNPYHKVRNEPIKPPKGTWVICGYGRFGKAVSRHLNYIGIKTVIVEADPDITLSPEGTISGRGTDAITLREAKITDAVAIVAGTDNDANNLSIVLTAQDEVKRYQVGAKRNEDYYERYGLNDLNEHKLHSENSQLLKLKRQSGRLFAIARQNFSRNEAVFEKAELDFIMQPASIVAGEILSIIKTPLLSTFLSLARRQKDQWANILISRLSSFIDDAATTWMIEISEQQTPAVMPFLKKDKITTGNILTHPRNRDKFLNCVVLLVHRKKNNSDAHHHKHYNRHALTKYDNFLLPEKDFQIFAGDQLLLCGDKESMGLMCWSISNINIYNYTHTGYELADGYIWRWLYKYKLLQQEKKVG